MMFNELQLHCRDVVIQVLEQLSDMNIGSLSYGPTRWFYLFLNLHFILINVNTKLKCFVSKYLRAINHTN